MIGSSMNALIRRAAGRDASRLEHDAPPHEGSIGIGRGGAAIPQTLRPDVSVQMNTAIRDAARIATNRVASDGVNLDDVWLWR